jgi:Tfp pilus assembly protein PilV
MGHPRLTRTSEKGGTLIEVLISSLILTVALLAVAATLGAGVSAMFVAQEELIAKQKAREGLESVFTARNTQNITFDQIRNVSSSGIFLDGFQPIKTMGNDGIVNTADDGSVETIVLAGKDGLLNTADDEVRSLSIFERKITITNLLTQSGTVDTDIRQIAIEVRFKIRNVWRTVSINSYISRFS